MLKRPRASSPPPSEPAHPFDGPLYERQPPKKRLRFLNDLDGKLDNTKAATERHSKAFLAHIERKKEWAGIGGEEDSDSGLDEEIDVDDDDRDAGMMGVRGLGPHVTTDGVKVKPPGAATTTFFHPSSTSNAREPSLSSSSTYAPINTLLGELHNIRMRKAQQGSSNRSIPIGPNSPSQPSASSDDGLKHVGDAVKGISSLSISGSSTTAPRTPRGLSLSPRAAGNALSPVPQASWNPLRSNNSSPRPIGRQLQISHIHSPLVSSPLRQALSRSESTGSLTADTLVLSSSKSVLDEEKETEAVRTRYEDINRLLGSLFLSRRRIQPEDDEDE